MLELNTTRRSASEGLAFGIFAGSIFLLVQVLGAIALGLSPVVPLRMATSLLFGADALEPSIIGAVPDTSAVSMGLIVHYSLSAIFGLAYGLAMNGRSPHTRQSYARQAGLGIGFGVALWLVNFHVIARGGYPWFLDAPQPAQMLIHGLAFGLPLGLAYALAERRAETPAIAGQPA